jgi:hypothetical protein
MGSPASGGGGGGPAYDSLTCFWSGGETTSEVGCSCQQHRLENDAGSGSLTGEGCQGGQSRGEVAALSSFRCSCTRKKGEGGRRVLQPW